MVQLIDAFMMVFLEVHLEVIFQVMEAKPRQEVGEVLVLEFIMEVLAIVRQQVSKTIIDRKIEEVAINIIKQVSKEV